MYWPAQKRASRVSNNLEYSKTLKPGASKTQKLGKPCSKIPAQIQICYIKCRILENHGKLACFCQGCMQGCKILLYIITCTTLSCKYWLSSLPSTDAICVVWRFVRTSVCRVTEKLCSKCSHLCLYYFVCPHFTEMYLKDVVYIYSSSWHTNRYAVIHHTYTLYVITFLHKVDIMANHSNSLNCCLIFLFYLSLIFKW